MQLSERRVSVGSVARKRSQPGERVPTYWATLKYKAWLRGRFEEEKKKNGLTWEEVARRIRKMGTPATNAGLTLFAIGEKGKPLEPSATHWLPMLNKIFGAAPPTLCDPESPMSQVKDTLDHLWRTATPEQKDELVKSANSWLALLKPTIEK